MIDFGSSYTAHWKVVSVDKDTWDDGEEVQGVASVSVNRDATDSVPLLETASFSIDGDVSDTFEEGWYRIVLDAEQNNRYERYAITTMLLQKANDQIMYGRSTSSVNGSSVLKPLEDRKNIGTDYRYVPKGTNGAYWVMDIISIASPAPVSVSGVGFVVDDNVLFSPGVSYLQMVWDVLDRGKWCMMIDGEGMITVCEKPTEPSVILTSDTVRDIVPGIKRTMDFASVCNRYFAIDRSGNREVAENRDPSSQFSYETRGRWIDHVDTSPTKINGETLYSYARRRLEEESTVVQSYSYSRAYWPDVVPFSIIRANIPEYGIDGDMRVLSQSIDCSGGILVNETAGIEIKGWTR